LRLYYNTDIKLYMDVDVMAKEAKTNRSPRKPKNPPDLNTLGGRIKHLRLNAGMKVTEFAEKANLLYPAAFGETDPAKDGGMSRISKWEACGYPLNETKGQMPPIHAIVKMAKVLDCEVGYLLCEFDCPRRDNADIQAVTGLSNEAIDNLKQITLNQDRRSIGNIHKLRLKAINAMLEGAAENFNPTGLMWDSVSTLLFDIDSMDVELSVKNADGVQLNVDPEIHKTVAINALKDKIFERMLTKQEDTNNDT